MDGWMGGWVLLFVPLRLVHGAVRCCIVCTYMYVGGW